MVSSDLFALADHLMYDLPNSLNLYLHDISFENVTETVEL